MAGNPPAPPFAVAGEWGYSPLRCQQGEFANSEHIIGPVGYLLDSGYPYRLWFPFDLGAGVKNPVQRNRLDSYRLLHEAEEELAAAF